MSRGGSHELPLAMDHQSRPRCDHSLTSGVLTDVKENISLKERTLLMFQEGSREGKGGKFPHPKPIVDHK